MSTISAGRGFRLALVTDNNSAATNTKGSLSYVYDSMTTNARSVITALSNTHYFDTDTKALPMVSTALALFMQWGTELPDAPTEAPIVESVEVYLEPIAL